MSEGKAAVRARRTARAVPHGQEIFELLQTPEPRAAIMAAADAGHPPVAAVSRLLIDAFGAETMRTAAVKMFTGLCVSAVLEDSYTVSASRVRLSNDPLFSTGTVYVRKVTPEGTGTLDLLERIIGCLDDSEIGRAMALLEARRSPVGQPRKVRDG